MIPLGVLASRGLSEEEQVANLAGWLTRAYAEDHSVGALPSIVNREGGSLTVTNGSTGLSIVDASTTNGTKSIRFPSSNRTVGGYATLPSVPSGDGEVWAVIKSDNANCGLWALGSVGVDVESHYPYSGVVYEGFGQAQGTRRSFTPGLTINAWRVYRIRAALGTNGWRADLDDVQQLAVTPSAISWPATGYVGVGVGGVNQTFDMSFQGNIAVFLLRDQISTAPEAALIYSHLKAFTGVGP